MVSSDADYFFELQTQTGWGRTLHNFATWCDPQPGWRTLDIGCGPGLLPAIFSQLGCRSVGVDLDIEMFHPIPLHSAVSVANILDLPFAYHNFELVTACNLLFLLPEPDRALWSMRQMLSKDGRIALINPSEGLTEQAAEAFAYEKDLQGVGRDSLLHWAKRAATHHRWTDAETRNLYRGAGMQCMGCELKVGPGFARFSWGVLKSGS